MKTPLALFICLWLALVSTTQAATRHDAPPAQAQPVSSKPSAAKPQFRKMRTLSNYIRERYAVPEDKAHAIVAEAMRRGAEHALDPALILAVIAVESRFQEKAVSRGGARGLMQIVPRYHSEKVAAIGGKQALLDSGHNIATGAQILADCLGDSKGNVRRALSRYNGGAKSRYPDLVLNHYRQIKQVAEGVT